MSAYHDQPLNLSGFFPIKVEQEQPNPNHVNNNGVHVIFIAHAGVWHSSAWERWAMDSPGTRLILHQEKEHAFPFEMTDLTNREAFREKYNVPPELRVFTSYGDISVVEAIVNSISYALSTAPDGNIPDLSTFSIVSGDSFPLQPAPALKSRESVIAIQEIQMSKRGGFPHGVVLHSMDMLLNRVDAQILVAEFPKWRDAILHYVKTNKINADEFAIGTILHHYHSTNPLSGHPPKRREMGGWLKKTALASDPLSSFPIDLSLSTPLHTGTLEFPIPGDTTKHGIAPADTTGRDVGESLLARAWPYSEFYWFRKLLPTSGITDVRLWSKRAVQPFVWKPSERETNNKKATKRFLKQNIFKR
jgi:hypothetical protein